MNLKTMIKIKPPKILSSLLNSSKLRMLIMNTGWLLSTEFISKLSRIITLIFIAKELSTTEYGTVFLALACHDIFRIFLRSGTGSLIIQCKEKDLESYASNGAAAQWIISITIFSAQYFLSPLIATFFNNHEIENLLKIMAFSYLFYPIVSNNVFMLQRNNNMKYFSLANGACIILENISIILFLILSFSIESIAYSKIAFSSFWVIFFLFSPIKYYKIGFNLPIIFSLLTQSGKIFSLEGLKAFRLQFDMIIAGKLFSPELLGIYSFAKSAGVGLSQSLSNAYIGALYPYLCKINRNNRLEKSYLIIFLMTAAVSLIFIIQAFAVPIYVPIIFGEKWDGSHLITSLLCLIAIPTIMVDSYCSFQRAKKSFLNEFVTRLACLAISTIGILLFNVNTPYSLAITLLSASGLWIIFILIQHFFKDNKTLLTYRKKHYECL